MSQLKYEIAILRTVVDSMVGDTEPIEAPGMTSACGRLVGRSRGVGSFTELQQTAWRMLEEGDILVTKNGILELDITAARRRVGTMIEFVNNHSASKTERSLGDTVSDLLDRLTALIGLRPAVATV